MAYIGRNPAYGSFEKQSLTADGSTTTFTLNFTVGSSSSIMVSVAGVFQEPEVAYNISDGGTKIVFTAAPESGDCNVAALKAKQSPRAHSGGTGPNVLIPGVLG